MDYAIGDLARRAGYAVQCVRYYEQTGLMPEPPRARAATPLRRGPSEAPAFHPPRA
jgi:hypothetical protein